MLTRFRAVTFFFALFLIVSLAFAQPSGGSSFMIGSFEYWTSVDDVMGDTDHYVSTTTIEQGNYLEADLTFRCVENSFEVVLSTQWDVSDDSVPIRYRFDQNTASDQQYWYPSSSGVAAFATNEAIDDILAQAATASQVVIRMTEIDNEDLDFVFPLSEFNEAITYLPCL